MEVVYPELEALLVANHVKWNAWSKEYNDSVAQQQQVAPESPSAPPPSPPGSLRPYLPSPAGSRLLTSSEDTGSGARRSPPVSPPSTRRVGTRNTQQIFAPSTYDYEPFNMETYIRRKKDAAEAVVKDAEKAIEKQKVEDAKARAKSLAEAEANRVLQAKARAEAEAAFEKKLQEEMRERQEAETVLYRASRAGGRQPILRVSSYKRPPPDDDVRRQLLTWINVESGRLPAYTERPKQTEKTENDWIESIVGTVMQWFGAPPKGRQTQTARF